MLRTNDKLPLSISPQQQYFSRSRPAAPQLTQCPKALSKGRLLHSTSPGWLRPTAAMAMPQAQIHNKAPHPQQISPSQPYPYHDKPVPLLRPPNLVHGMAATSCTACGLPPSPAKAGTGALSVAPATMLNVGTVNTVAQPGLRPIRPRSGSVGRSTTGGATKTPAGTPGLLICE
ncbi:hypothetical protein Vretimale_15700 [Volvox reticuliferus]|uniref:Uncharacterized protein n=1 Tax=Volvox reticuliferus TaxID=1737510 RepID=A0A8J4CVD5_9CHLO|nr:hypothetical protein Vretifemale_18383 [Volvox reticuliferus]GIM12342.1 hypothetical protein Vretimale_15700 [Volvox reticuliferus]